MKAMIKRLAAIITVFLMLFLAGCSILPFEGKTLEDGKVGVAYETSIATGTKDMYYDLDYDSNLPKGLILYDDGIIKGVPKEAGDFTFKAVMIDLNDNEYYADFTMHIETGELVYSGGALPDGKTGEPYRQDIATATGMPDITYALKEGTELPAGLELVDGVLSGIPTKAGEDLTFTIVATASGCDPAEAIFTLNIEQGEIVDDTAGKIIFENFTLPDGLVGEEYNQSVRFASGVPGITYSFRFPTGNGLPSGLKSDKNLGIIYGTPTNSTYGTITFNVTASAEGYDPVTVKCTLQVYDKYVETNRFEAEYIYMDRLSGAGYSSSPTGTGMIQACQNMSNAHSLGYLYKPAEFSFVINADAATDAKLVLALGSEIGDFTYDASLFQIYVNGVEINYGTLNIRQQGETESTYLVDRLEVSPTIHLVEGENTITFKINASDKAPEYGGTFTAIGCLFDYIELTNTTVKLGWRPKVANVQ